MKYFLSLAAAFALMFASPAYAGEWKDMNAQINQTNFIVSDGCSGTLISIKYRLIITAHHCIETFVTQVEREETQPDGTVKMVKRELLLDMPVTQKSYKGHRLVGNSTYQTQIVAHNRKMDLALLQIRSDIPQTLFSQVLPVGKSVERGDEVYVVGNPLGLLDASLTSGIVSSVTRMLRTPWAEDNEVEFFQVDAAINPGNSGGALYNDSGQLIGLPDAGYAGANLLGFALTASSVQSFLTANCYGELYDASAQPHDACAAAKKTINKR